MPIFQKATKRLSPSRTLVLGFLAIILAGSVLLFLPISSKSGELTNFFDCFFTACSAVCVTGLVIYDTFTHWSVFGQVIIALLIQIGGLGFVTIITFFNIAAGKKLGFRTLANAADGLTESSFEGGRKIFISIMKYSLIFELVGAIVLGFVFVPKFGAYGIWISAFTSVSAFCNAGFDLMGIVEPFSGLVSLQDNPLVIITISLLIIVGGLGFIVWENLINIRTEKKLSLHTRAVFVMVAVLVLSGTVFYLISEWSNPATMGNMGFGEKLLNAFFTSVTTRSAGFNTIPIGEMTDFSLLSTILLMFIGSAPASTGGGIKTTTLLVMVMTVVSYMKNRNDVVIFGHKIDKLTVYRTLVVTVLSMAAVGICFTGLYCTMPSPDGETPNALHCLFDTVATFSTAGLSTGVAVNSGMLGKALLMITMFAGRIGPVSLIMSLVLSSAKRKNVIVPDGQIIIG